ncbi:LpxL/LpxP family acyltransferase [Neoroseomonas oryzicola]|uniref:Lipid A biosynthesis acyltransferase n=1 Tax=Neoroseomonas oryzicola TaxID=535904 RepID=A0A9X9WIC0_9PROT|nr:lipid A biosynthesis acyltransferase [Neoroseomonas oryzicola]MBR0660080.1 lipid A biosynthesis acyltransferase [Neoroseomonas oryzicola]NKE18199.1 lipid A biosynthesis acyltransferase [Neoroseomonas oryzicola]
MTGGWAATPERGTGAALRLMARIALGLGWPVAQALLHPITAFYLATSPAAQKRAARRYLTRALGREAGWGDLWRLYFCFASTMLDRVYLLTGRSAGYRVEITGLETLHAAAERGQGLVLLGAHMGSFEALRAVGGAGAPVEVRMLMHTANAGPADALFDSLDPTRRAAVIELGRPEAMLTAREVIERGGVVGILADRAPRGERMVPVDFLGDPAPFPSGPMTVAAVLRAPVVLGFGLWVGPRRYALHFEAFSPALALPRETREEALRGWIARYAARLAEMCRAHPHNWFNFYDFWREEER